MNTNSNLNTQNPSEYNNNFNNMNYNLYSNYNFPQNLISNDLTNYNISKYQDLTNENSNKEQINNQSNHYINTQNLENMNNNSNINYNNYNNQNNFIPKHQDKVFKFVGDPISCNMNNLLLNNILSCQYFKDVCGMMDYFHLIEEIIKNVTYAEPWTVGTNGIPSTLFCILYKFMLMKLTESQVYYLVNYPENDYVRCAGFLYMRYMSDPKELWGLFYPYLYDDKSIFFFSYKFI